MHIGWLIRDMKHVHNYSYFHEKLFEIEKFREKNRLIYIKPKDEWEKFILKIRSRGREIEKTPDPIMLAKWGGSFVRSFLETITSPFKRLYVHNQITLSNRLLIWNPFSHFFWPSENVLFPWTLQLFIRPYMGSIESHHIKSYLSMNWHQRQRHQHHLHHHQQHLCRIVVVFIDGHSLSNWMGFLNCQIVDTL